MSEKVNDRDYLTTVSTKVLEQRFRAIVESAPTAMVMICQTGEIVLVNSETERLFGYSREELLGQPVEILVPERFRPEHPGHRIGFFAEPIARSMGAGRDLFGLRKDGTELPIELGLNPVETDEGLFVISAIIDISERKLAESQMQQANAALEQMERRFRATVESSPTAMVMIDEAGQIVLINAETEKLFGYLREEILGQPVEILVPERFRPEHPGHRIGFFAKPTARSMGEGRDLHGLRKDGTEVPIEIGLNPLVTDEGIFALASVIDITERLRAEEANLYLASVLESSDDAIISKNLDGIIRSWNKGAERVFGYSAEEMIGTRMTRLLPPDRQHEEEKILAQLRQGQLVDHIETVRLCKDGKLIDISATISPIHNSFGQIVGASKVARDITDRKRGEARLQEAMEALEQSNLELEQFAYVASHDLQEPLRKISSYAQLLQEEYGEVLKEEGNAYLQTMVRGAHRLKKLIGDLLSFSRITTRGNPLEPVDSKACLQAALENLELAIKESESNISYDHLPSVIADQSQLTLLFQNLVGNAIKYRGAKTPDIRVGGRDQGDQFEFSIQDNGIGIAPEFYDRIFQIFQRLHNRREYSGTGIGLAVSKRVVERFGGKLWLESTPDIGSTFYFTVNKSIP